MEEVFLELLEKNLGCPDILNNIEVIHCTNKTCEQAGACFVKALEIDGSHLKARLR